MAFDIRIDNGVILTLDPERRIIREGSVVIDKDRIVDVGKTQEIKDKYKANRIINATHKLVIPGLINAHIHFYHHMHKGLAPEILPVWQWAGYVHEHFAPFIESEHEIYGGLAVLLETLKSGATSFLEAGCYHPHEVMEEIGKIGMRGWMGKRVFDQVIVGDDMQVQSTEECLSTCEKFLHQYEARLRNGSRVKPCIALRGWATCSDKLLIESKKMADKYGVPLNIHWAIMLEEVNETYRRTGHRPVEHLYNLGILGPNVVLVHMVHVNDREMRRKFWIELRILVMMF